MLGSTMILTLTGGRFLPSAANDRLLDGVFIAALCKIDLLR